MGLSNLSFSATNINTGNDADKPVNPKAGDIYVATDTNIVYVCYTNGTFVSINPPIPALSTDYSKLRKLYSKSTNILYENTATTGYLDAVNGDYSEQFITSIIPNDLVLNNDTVTIGYDVLVEWGNGQAYKVKIYVNDVLKSEKTYTLTGSEIWETKHVDVEGVSAGDVIDIYCQMSCYYKTNTCKFRNARFEGTLIDNAAAPTFT